MKKILIGILALVVLVVAAAVIVPFFIPLDAVKEQITTRAEEATGRKLTIAGDFDLSILPRVRIKAGNVTFANAPGAKQANMLELAELEVGVSLFPLISGQVEVSSFVLIDPVINLEVDAKGRPNWQFEDKESSKGSDEKSKKSGGGDSGDSKGLREISLGDVRLVNGTVRFSDAQVGTSQEIQSINAQINLPSLDQALSADGSLAWNGETIDLSLKVDQPRALMEGASTGVETSIKSSPVTLDYKGTVTNAKPAAVTGDISLNVPSIRKLAAWAGKPIEAAGGGLGPLSIKGTLDMAGKSIAFRGAKISIDNMNATGDFEVDTSASVPSIVASLEVDKLDLNTYLPPESDKPAAPSSGGGAAAPATGGASAGPSDWSDDPIDFSALKLVNADLSFVTGGIFVKEIKVGRTALKTVLLGGKLALDLNEMALYDGQGTGRITVDAGRNTITQKLDLKGVQAAPLLTDAAGFDRVEGTANIVTDVTTRGASQRQLVSALNGKGSIQFLDGAVRGINLAAMLRNVSSAFLDSSAKETQKTDFAELAGTYTITNGIVKNDDLFLKSPLLRIDGKGTSDIPKR
ncbi:MAG: AsmA protein, partial [Alphaproteobacteria bacterium]